MKFLGVLLNDNLLWKEDITYLENKIAKNIGLVYRARPFLDRESLLARYYSYIHSYLNYANLAWGSTYLTNVLNLYKLNMLSIAIFMHRVHTKTSPLVFPGSFQRTSHL